jgi:hypothetical protein
VTEEKWERMERGDQQVVLRVASPLCWAHGEHRGASNCESAFHVCNEPADPASSLGLCTHHHKEIM